jgi:hypothetical protein
LEFGSFWKSERERKIREEEAKKDSKREQRQKRLLSRKHAGRKVK